MKIVYNPRTYGSKPSAKINDIWLGKAVVLDVNSMKKFNDDNLATYLLKKYNFLQEVEVDRVIKVQSEIDKPESSKDEDEIKQRLLKNLNPKQLEALEAVPVADEGETTQVTSFTQTKPQTPEESAGIPSGDGVKDQDGVTWVGDGLQEDKPEGFMAPRRPGKKGVFGAA